MGHTGVRVYMPCLLSVDGLGLGDKGHDKGQGVLVEGGVLMVCSRCDSDSDNRFIAWYWPEYGSICHPCWQYLHNYFLSVVRYSSGSYDESKCDRCGCHIRRNDPFLDLLGEYLCGFCAEKWVGKMCKIKRDKPGVCWPKEGF